MKQMPKMISSSPPFSICPFSPRKVRSMLSMKLASAPSTKLWEMYVHSIVVRMVVTKNVVVREAINIFLMCLISKM